MPRSRLLLALIQASALAFAQAPAEVPGPDFRQLSRKVDALLRKENGTRLEIDPTEYEAIRFKRPTNRVYWHSSTDDRRLVRIEVEPLVPEDENTTLLTAALLVSVAAVENLEEGVRVATLVKEAQATDGRTRMIQLRNGVKLYRLKPDNEAAKFQIGL